jgi:hypothetical protein
MALAAHPLMALRSIGTGLAVPAEAATYYSATLRTAARSLPVAAENNAGYDRTRYFGAWLDANRDCQNTCAEVLLQEAKAAATYTTTRKCTVRTARWVTTWDNRTHYSATAVEIDHTVPVHEAWGSLLVAGAAGGVLQRSGRRALPECPDGGPELREAGSGA